ncbi:MAG: PilZ domain-containing protein [Pseudomonadota bacterium]
MQTLQGEDRQSLAPDRRVARRTRQLKSGRMIFNDASSTLDCTIRDATREGARLQLDASHRVPKVFDLVWVQRGSARRCEVVWRGGNQIGVKFDPEKFRENDLPR